MVCKITLLSVAIIFGLIAPTMRVAVNLINLKESNKFIDDITVDRATFIGQANDDIPIKNILNLIGTTMFVYIYLCRFFQTKNGWLSIIGLVFAVLFTITDEILKNFPNRVTSNTILKLALLVPSRKNAGTNTE